MTFIIKDRVRESTTTTGTGAFALGGAVSGYRAFNSVMVNGDTTWYACVLPGGAWEVGIGTWVTGNTLQRTTLLDSSTGSAISFSAGTKDIFIALPASKANVQNNIYQTGTLTVFQQTSAPLYWTKQVTHNDKALRVVSGAAGSGGGQSFTTALVNTVTVSSHTVSSFEMPGHTHSTFSMVSGSQKPNGTGTQPYDSTTPSGTTTGSTGGDGGHTHPLTLNVHYVDIIIASKD